MARVACEMDEHWGIDYTHYSSLPNGAPFNNRKEETSDVTSITYKFKLK